MKHMTAIDQYAEHINTINSLKGLKNQVYKWEESVESTDLLHGEFLQRSAEGRSIEEVAGSLSIKIPEHTTIALRTETEANDRLRDLHRKRKEIEESISRCIANDDELLCKSNNIAEQIKIAEKNNRSQKIRNLILIPFVFIAGWALLSLLELSWIIIQGGVE